MAKSQIPTPDPVIESEPEESEAEASDSEAKPKPKPKSKVADSSSSSGDSDSESESDSSPVKPKPPVKRKLSNLFERVFQVDDEVVLLKEWLKRYPSPNIDDLYESVKSTLSSSFNKVQVSSKMKRLKANFFKKKERKNKGENVKEDDVYQLSEKIWGSEEGPKPVVNKVPSSKIAVRFEEAMEKAEEEKKKSYNYGPIDEWVFGEGSALLAQEVRSELEEEWKKIRKEETRIHVEKLKLSTKHAKMVYAAMDS